MSKTYLKSDHFSGGGSGSYSLENVECLTNTQNGYARRLNGCAARGESRPNSILNWQTG